MHLFTRILFAIIYTTVYVALALENVGAEGKGSSVFFAPLLTWILVLIAIFLLSHGISTFRRIFVAALLGIHYGITALSVFNYFAQDNGHVGHSWNEFPAAVVLAIVWYLMGQCVIWLGVFRKLPFNSRLS